MFISATTLYFSRKRKPAKHKSKKTVRRPTGFATWETYLKARTAFYASPEWAEIRKRVFAAYPAKCAFCGTMHTAENPLQVDHKEPLWRAWYRRLDFSNLQILCAKCNNAKGGLTDREFRAGKRQNNKCQKRKQKKKR